MNNEPKPSAETPGGGAAGRRFFLARASSFAMAGGLVAGYGTLAAVAGRYLYPARQAPRGWMYVAQAASLKPGDSLAYRAPDGQRIAIARIGSEGTATDFLALSSTCPHLGCQVHWEAQNDRFFCPCHNGAFDRQGNATAGPPAAAGQALLRFPLRLENGLLFIEVPIP